MTPLWTAAEAAAATGGHHRTDWIASGVSIDSRTLAAGDLFIALAGPRHDGHDFLGTALARGAAAAMVHRDPDPAPAAPPLLRVADTFAGLNALGAAARARGRARIAAVTGSVGKTGTKELLRLALAVAGPTFAAAGNLNNHWGVPLSLARLPADAAYAVFELGMNHAGEIAGLARLVRPHVAVITTLGPAHLGFFPSVEAIADAKAEIFLGLEPGGTAVLNRDDPHYDRLAGAARAAGAAAVLGFGVHPEADLRLAECAPDAAGHTFAASFCGTELNCRLPVPGRHWVTNALAAVAAAAALGADPARAAAALVGFAALPGRGRRYRIPWGGGEVTLIDESYNASPPAMAAALAVLGATTPKAGGRRIAVLGDMLELGAESDRLHRGLAGPLAAAAVDRVFLVGAAVAALAAALPTAMRGGLWPSADEAIPAIFEFLRAGDVVMVKGSHAARADRIAARLRARAAPEA
jgi:UDP-N-acetylmuramoyl-tripeptide--D-alanyl-D-alanine ligase